MTAIFLKLYEIPWPGIPGYLFGTFLLAFAGVVIGEFTLSIAFRFNRKHIEGLVSRMRHMNDLAKEANRRGEMRDYRALNREANDAHGQVFFNKFGLSAASLWPVFFALDFQQNHFGLFTVPIPWTSLSANYVVVFLICYILARIVFGRVKRHLPYFKGQYEMLHAQEKAERECMTDSTNS
jgi:hypothetical protein